MKLETAKKIVEAAENIGGLDVKLHDNYSGRCMFGRNTAGVVFGSLGELLKSVAYAAKEMAEEDNPEDGLIGDDPDSNENVNYDPFQLEKFIEDLSNVRTDSMGRDTIIY